MSLAPPLRDPTVRSQRKRGQVMAPSGSRRRALRAALILFALRSGCEAREAAAEPSSGLASPWFAGISAGPAFGYSTTSRSSGSRRTLSPGISLTWVGGYSLHWTRVRADLGVGLNHLRLSSTAPSTSERDGLKLSTAHDYILPSLELSVATCCDSPVSASCGLTLATGPDVRTGAEGGTTYVPMAAAARAGIAVLLGASVEAQLGVAWFVAGRELGAVSPQLGLRIRPSRVASDPRPKHASPEGTSVLSFGAAGDGTTDDAAAIQAAIDAGGPVFFPQAVYAVSRPVIFRSRATYRGAGPKSTYLKALSPMDAVAIIARDDIVIDGLSFDANRQATDAITFAGANGTEFRSCDFRNAKRHGVYGGHTSNNNKIRFEKCTARYNGTRVGVGSVSCTRGSTRITFSTPVNLNELESVGTYLIAEAVQSTPLIVDHFVSPTEAEVLFPPSASHQEAQYLLYSGNGFDMSHHSDDNLWDFTDCYAVGNAKAGFDLKSLYGPILTNPTSDANLLGVKIGTRGGSEQAAPFGTQIYRGYFEGNRIDVVVENSHGTTVIDPIGSNREYIWAPDAVGYHSVFYTREGSARSFNHATSALQRKNQTYAHRGSSAPGGKLIAPNGTYAFGIRGLDCSAAVLAVLAYGGGENGADRGAVSYYVTDCSEQGATLVLKNAADRPQSIHFDITASGW